MASSKVLPSNVESSREEDITRSVYKNGHFSNPWTTWSKPKIGGLLKFMWFDKDNSQIPGKTELDVTLPILKPDFTLHAAPPSDGIRVTWIGHASVLVQFDGINLITDPIFSQRCSPFSFAGPKRYRDPPCTVDDLPRLDAVVISHNHYDHLDRATVQQLNARFGSALRWFVPLKLAKWMHSVGCENVSEQDWWEESILPEQPEEIKFVFTPVQHHSRRGLADGEAVLWGSWSVIGPRHSFFFAGDTGFCEAFEQIGRKYGPFDLAAIPIGPCVMNWAIFVSQGQNDHFLNIFIFHKTNFSASGNIKQTLLGFLFFKIFRVLCGFLN